MSPGPAIAIRDWLALDRTTLSRKPSLTQWSIALNPAVTGGRHLPQSRGQDGSKKECKTHLGQRRQTLG